MAPSDKKIPDQAAITKAFEKYVSKPKGDEDPMRMAKLAASGNKIHAKKILEAKTAAKADPDAAPAEAPPPRVRPGVLFVSRDKEPSQLRVAGYKPIRNFSTGLLEYRIPKEDCARFEANHFVLNGRIQRGPAVD